MEFIDELDYRIFIKYPSDWDKILAKMGTIVVFLSPFEHKYDKFRENLSIIVKDLVINSINPKEYIKFDIEQLKETILDFQLFKKRITKISGNPAYRLVYTGKQQGFKLRFLQLSIIKEQKIYLLTYTAELENFEKYNKIIKKMIKSFKFI